MKKLFLISIIICLLACNRGSQYQIMGKHETELVKEWLKDNHSNVHFYDEKKVFYPIGYIGEDGYLYNDYNAVEYVFFLNDNEKSSEKTKSPDGKERNSCSCFFLIEQDAVIGLNDYWSMVSNTSNDYKSKYIKKEKRIK